MRKLSLLLFAAAAAVFMIQAPLTEASRPQPVIWADCEMYDGIVTPATFEPNSDAFDELYVGSFRDGLNLISDAAPGYGDYNGGRWHKNVLKGSVDPGKYANACSVDDLDLSDFESTNDYFSCPMRPRRGNDDN